MSDVPLLHSSERLAASSTDELVSVLKARQAEVAAIIAERKPAHAQARLSSLIDGVWSPTSIKAVRRLRTVAIQLNSLWASLPPTWTCPCCRRPKEQAIYTTDVDAQLPERGRAAIAHAVEHHDNFTAYVNHAFHRDLGQDWGRRFPTAQDVQRRLSTGVTAFDPAVICEPCHVAAWQAKLVLWRRLSLEKAFRDYFSFAIDEIRAFIRPVANAHHEIDEAAVIATFQRTRKREIMVFRKEEVDKQVRLIKEGNHWLSPEPPAPDANAVNEVYQMTLLEFGLEQSPNFSFSDISATSQGQPVDPDAWITKAPKRTTLVLDREAETFLRTDPMAQELGRAWSCPCCKRTIRAAIRRNNKRALTLQPRTVRPGDQEAQVVCIDCCTAMQRIAGSAQAARDDVSFDDVREVFVFATNESHWVRSADVARTVIERVRTRAEDKRAAADSQCPRLFTDHLPVERLPRPMMLPGRLRRPSREGGLY